jgi:hypothetical protein
MQTIIAILIIAAAAFFLIRRFYNSLRAKNQSTCGCGCDGCSPTQKENCSDMGNHPR